jgi:hypothetical protein
MVQLVCFFVATVYESYLIYVDYSLSSSQSTVSSHRIPLQSLTPHPQAFYIVIFGLSLWVLIRRKRQGYRWHLMFSTVLFILSTVQVGLLMANYATKKKEVLARHLNDGDEDSILLALVNRLGTVQFLSTIMSL